MGENSGERLKRVRKDLGLTQNDICGKFNRTFISKIENGKREMDMDVAREVSKILNIEKKNRNRNIPYEITPEFLVGRTSDGIDRLVDNLKDGTKYAFHEIDEFLESCTKEYGEILINRIYEEILKKEMYKYSKEINKYTHKLLELVSGKKKVAEIYVRLIAVTMLDDTPDKYKRILDYSETVGNDIKYCDDRNKLIFYHNVSIACRHMKEYDKGLEIICEAKKIKNNPFKLLMLNNEAVIYIKQERFPKAINIYRQIIAESDNPDDTANSYSNLADIYNTIGKLDLANQYIDRAFELIDKLDNHYKYNLYYVKLQIEIKENLDITSTLKNVLISTKDLNDKIKRETILKITMDYYNTDEIKLGNMVSILYELQIQTKSLFLMDIFPLISNDELRKMIFEIPRY